jgi:hypothetical protein
MPVTIHILFGPYGSTALHFADRFQDFGANAAWFHGFDMAAFEVCTRHAIAPCVEFKTFRADFDAHPELIPTGVDGKPIRYGELVQGVCLSQKDFLEETEADLLKGLAEFKPAGIWLDYLTYAGWFETPQPDLQESCFCRDCITDFCQATGIDAETPYQILHTAQAAWTQHKCERIAHLGSHYARLVREAHPDCIVGVYMCPWTPEEYDGALRRIFAQDYALLAPSIDVFTPLIYAHKSGREAEWGRQFLEQSLDFIPAERQVQLILDALDFPYSLLAVVESSRQSWGIQIFGGAEVFADPAKAEIFSLAVGQLLARLG